MDEHNPMELISLKRFREIKKRCPHARTSGGISNVSFSFRGNNHVREAMHAAFFTMPAKLAWIWELSTRVCLQCMTKLILNFGNLR